jgi:putative acetyltransferase
VLKRHFGACFSCSICILTLFAHLTSGECMSTEIPSLELRPARERDRDAIAAIWHSSASMPGVGPPVMPTPDQLRKRVDLEFASGWDVTVAACGKGIAGFLALRMDKAVLDQLFVRPDLIGLGVGRMLLSHAMTMMAKGFTLYTRPTNRRACRFYEKMGLVFIKSGLHPRSCDPIVYYRWDGR